MSAETIRFTPTEAAAATALVASEPAGRAARSANRPGAASDQARTSLPAPKDCQNPPTAPQPQDSAESKADAQTRRIATLEALLGELLRHDEHHAGSWTSGMRNRVRAALGLVSAGEVDQWLREKIAEIRASEDALQAAREART